MFRWQSALIPPYSVHSFLRRVWTGAGSLPGERVRASLACPPSPVRRSLGEPGSFGGKGQPASRASDCKSCAMNTYEKHASKSRRMCTYNGCGLYLQPASKTLGCNPRVMNTYKKRGGGVDGLCYIQPLCQRRPTGHRCSRVSRCGYNGVCTFWRHRAWQRRKKSWQR